MKKHMLTFLFILLNFSINSQTILERLDSPDYSVRLGALIEIRDNNLTEYSSDLLDRIFKQPTLFLTHFFIDVLFRIGYSDLVDIIYQFIDLCDQFPQEQPLYHKVKATELLVKLNDLNTVGYVFEYINIDPLRNGERFIPLLKEIALEMPQHAQAIKDLLINIKDNSEFYYNRREALGNLILIFGENSLQTEILSSIINDLNMNIRNFAMKHYNFPDRKNLLRQQIENDSDSYRRLNYSEIYLKEFGEPDDLKFIKDYSLIEPDEVAKKSITHQTIGFIPPKPVNQSLDLMINNLISYTEELYQYDWIKKEEAYNYYVDRLVDLRESLYAGDLEMACSIINERILPQVEQDLQEELITIEGYKFLHYHTVYISESMEEVLGPCE